MLLPLRLAAGRLILDQETEVRILEGQPKLFSKKFILGVAILVRITYIIRVVRKKERIMKEALENYIAACEQNIAQYMLIEDQEERQRALDAAYGMKADFEKMLEDLA